MIYAVYQLTDKGPIRWAILDDDGMLQLAQYLVDSADPDLLPKFRVSRFAQADEIPLLQYIETKNLQKRSLMEKLEAEKENARR